MSTTSVSPLRQRMIEDMSLRNLAPRTQQAYIRGCSKLAAFLRRSPDTATGEDIRLFQLHLAEQGVSICTRNRTMTGIAFLFRVTLRRPEIADQIEYIAEPQKIPLVLSKVARGKRPEPPPSELATVLSGLAGYLAVGQIPKPISDVKREGRRIPGPEERRDIGWAVAYREACRPTGLVHEGKTVHVKDHAPVKTLTGWFGVQSRTVRGWLKSYPPAFLGVGAINANVVLYRTRQAGARYKRCGRGHEAVRARGRKVNATGTVRRTVTTANSRD